MERKARDAAAMAAQLQQDRENSKLYRGTDKPQYPDAAAAVRMDAIKESIEQQQAALQAAYKRGRFNLHDTEAVRAQSMVYMEACKRAGVLPTLMGFSASLGLSRQRIYSFLQENPQSATAELIDQLRSAWAAILAQVALAKQADAPTAIFLLKNAGQGLADKSELELSQKPQPRGPLDAVTDPEERRRRIEAAVIDEE